MDKEGFRVHNIQAGCFLPWNRYAETATRIIKTSHKIWLRRTQRVFHIGGWKKKHWRKVSFFQQTGKSPWQAKLQMGCEVTIQNGFKKNCSTTFFSVGLTSGQRRPLKGTTLVLNREIKEVLNLEAIVTELWRRTHWHLTQFHQGHVV